MISVIQRVNHANVSINGNVYSSIGKGLLVLLGIHKTDSEPDCRAMAKKITDLRIFNDENDKMNLSVKDTEGEVLVISQFTLCTDNGKSGNRPSFFKAELPERANKMYELFIDEMKSVYTEEKIRKGVFGEMMEVNLCNDGPVTIILERI